MVSILEIIWNYMKAFSFIVTYLQASFQNEFFNSPKSRTKIPALISFNQNRQVIHLICRN
ncbi:hypothetical protein HMPREF9103_01399 [Lentilactobacillus parafarraginis F0439]|uniref:Uncharacterized protein n=1 Tax=Lentilactobacillus parafarraginis F0439 TaxID=797515 RepID=G9ZNU5_9LACO|nr:hypothetical protein HMPREF9103_01399 [Lentilactobacillus parafarraginis F0439]